MASFSNFKSTIVQASQTAAGVATGVTVYANTDALPYVGNSDGDQAYVSSNNRLYIWQGSGWYNVALINRAPAISAVQDSDGNTTPFALSNEGVVTTITITAADSDGDPITYSATADSDFNGLASITNAGNEFTITPFSQDSASTTSGTITFKATDGINIASSGVQTFTLAFLSALWDETVLSIGTSSTNSLDNSTFIDRSTNAHTVTTSGSPVQTAFHPYLDNWSVEFGDNNYLTLASTVVNDISSGTFEFWVNVPDLSENFICAKQIDGTGTEGVISITNYVNSSGVKASGTSGRIYFHPRNGIVQAVNNTAITPNTWHHVAVCFSNSQVQFFLDGVPDGTTAGNYSIPNTTSQPWRIGYWGQGSEKGDFEGYLSDFRVSNIVRYSNSFTPSELSSDSDTLLLTCKSNRFIDNSSNDHTITPASNVKVSAFNPFGQESEYAVGGNKGATYFDGSGDYLQIADNDDFHIGASDFTIEGWIYKEDKGTWSSLIGQRQASNAEWRIILDINASSYVEGVFRFDWGSGLPVWSSANIPNNSWTHFALVRSGTTGTLYINGTSVGTNTLNDVSNFSAPLRIGTNDGSGEYYKGSISDLRIIKGTAIYTTNFTPPTAPVGNTSASLYLPMDNAGIFDKTGNHALTLFGNTSTSNTQTKFANTSIYFDGNNDYITNDDDLTLGTGDWTIEMWLYPTSVAGPRNIVDFRDGSNSGNQAVPVIVIPTGVNGTIHYYVSGASRITGSISANVWTHIAVCKSSNVTKMFINGTQAGSNFADTINYVAGQLTLGLYRPNLGGDYAGYIENLQVLKGVAKYTSNFTVPSQEQGRTYQAED